MPKQRDHSNAIDIVAIAHRSVMEAGFEPRLNAEVRQQVDKIVSSPPSIAARDAIRDLRKLLWSSIDNRESRDLDQLEFAEELSDGDKRLLVAIADVDAFVPQGSPIDRHAAENSVSVYTGVKTFPMLPEELSNDLTSLIPEHDRLAVVTQMLVAPDGNVKSIEIYRAVVRSKAKLSYESVGQWLDEKGEMPPKVAAVPGLDAQIRLQFEIANRLAELRVQQGALELGTIQANPVVNDQGKVTKLSVVEPNGARELIASFMIAANVSMATFLEDAGRSSLRRIVRTPKYWSRIVEIAEDLGEKLPADPDSRALAEFLQRQKTADPDHFADLSLAVVKSLGPGEYAVETRGSEGEGHFGLAVQDYTHSTAPNRRYPDLIMQRLVKAALEKKPAPYKNEELEKIAEHCNQRGDAARKVERKMRKVAAAVLLQDKIGQHFNAIVTGATEKGTFARLISPPVDGRVMRGERGLRVGDKTRVRLVSTDPERGYIDFARA
ncbi:MAG TPA: RNB domain-containing ribonuclease [Pyrinomonadaceae bacterium]|nr:RNB domain-containing ribonuclease [Pyrinomonadaceae bacterium]